LTSLWPDNPFEALFTTKPSVPRVLAGAVLIVGGTIAFVGAQVDIVGYVRTALIPVLLTVAGIALVSGPWLLRLGQQLTEERRSRIRLEERSEIAAHLHDSVLQTLALIQRTSDPRTVSSLARVQERELRAWLYGRSGSFDDAFLSVALDAIAGRIEQRHQVPVEVVVVGDVRMNDRLQSFLAACAEAVSNSARHSDAPLVSVYVEIENGVITAYVRDEGRGFAIADVPDDRRGISESITGRLERIGGSATIQSAPGTGTEVQLRMTVQR
jgi:signal transduction histidine kinase